MTQTKLTNSTRKPPHVIAFFGRSGCGKSHAMSHIAQALNLAGKTYSVFEQGYSPYGSYFGAATNTEDFLLVEELTDTDLIICFSLEEYLQEMKRLGLDKRPSKKRKRTKTK
jgi:ABC-type lipoprotein export system ATPase subunit